MTPIENRLLSNSLDALDRLFDRETTAVDLCALFEATAEALRGTPHQREFAITVLALEPFVWSSLSRNEKDERALEVTGELRHYLAGLPIEYENM